ncbi:MAG: recombinase family protein [Candidatus Margulisiibacteriota bacterium]
MTIHYFLYTRKSSEGEDRQVASIPAQIEELKKLAKLNNLQIADIFIEEKSAKAPGRPIFAEMLGRIHNGEANGILCWKLDRLARNPIDGGSISWMLQQGIIQHIQTYQRSYYPTDNVLMMNLEFGMANQYIIDLSLNIKRGQRQKLAEGWLPHKPPLGYLNNKYHDTDKPPIYPDPLRFLILKKCWQILIDKKVTVEQLRTIATDMGLRMPNGKKIVESQFYALFKNPFYYGHFLWNDELYEGKHEPMLTKQEFDLAQDIISGKLKSRPHHRTFSYTGLMRCGECGAAITAEKKTKNQKNGNIHHYTYYHCTKQMHPTCTQKTIREEVLEAQMADILESIHIPDDFHQWAIKTLKEDKLKEETNNHDIIQVHQDNLSLCNRKLETLLSMRLNNELDADDYIKRKNELMEEKCRLKEILEDTQTRIDTWITRAEELFIFAKTAKTRFEIGTHEEKRRILQALGSNLFLAERTLRVELNEPLSLIKAMAPEAKSIISKLEPVFAKNPRLKQAKLNEEFAQNELWWR